jgi:3'-phosphoadenosine 5'-phosphosulfate sulfotransferase (PAPS reductase)/FAD synthetase
MKKSDNIICAVSAGLTSVMMAIKMKEWYPNCNIVNVFLNTGKEDLRSLEFMNECDKYYNLNLVWLESIIYSEKNIGSSYKVTSYSNLDTSGKIFEKGIKKYGIPNVANKWCNRELKLVPLEKYANALFGRNNWSLALGIRTDEIDRVSENYKTNNIFYPPFENKIDSRQRNKFWNQEPIKLNIKGYEGNCDFCFEKSKRKRMTIAIENPEKYIWWDEMEKKYSLIEIEGKEQYNNTIKNSGVYFGRMNESIEQLVQEAKKPFKKATDEYIYENDLFDLESDCGKTCNLEF